MRVKQLSIAVAAAMSLAAFGIAPKVATLVPEGAGRRSTDALTRRPLHWNAHRSVWARGGGLSGAFRRRGQNGHE
ncbi:hypothetical protein WDL1CHR_04696 [Variovorax sp. WDL1]|nr:hypothetical protein CHC06_06723 [Variovorax sp. B2]PNG47796.1 hypothetical protein CHC07_06964 [Variovorax sp. B4]VTV14116.1 hypothetical protein WDL1CHR_04696 [Variovorax sp. WDL1]